MQMNQQDDAVGLFAVSFFPYGQDSYD